MDVRTYGRTDGQTDRRTAGQIAERPRISPSPLPRVHSPTTGPHASNASRFDSLSDASSAARRARRRSASAPAAHSSRSASASAAVALWWPRSSSFSRRCSPLSSASCPPDGTPPPPPPSDSVSSRACERVRWTARSASTRSNERRTSSTCSGEARRRPITIERDANLSMRQLCSIFSQSSIIFCFVCYTIMTIIQHTPNYFVSSSCFVTLFVGGCFVRDPSLENKSRFFFTFLYPYLGVERGPASRPPTPLTSEWSVGSPGAPVSRAMDASSRRSVSSSRSSSPASV